MSKRRDEVEGWENKRHNSMCEKLNECQGDGSSKQMIRDVNAMGSGERLSIINVSTSYHIMYTVLIIVFPRRNYRVTGELSHRSELPNCADSVVDRFR
jgi:hypothetical protein